MDDIRSLEEDRILVVVPLPLCWGKRAGQGLKQQEKIMEISGVSIPTTPASGQEPPRDAQLENAVPEAAEGEAMNNGASEQRSGGADDRDSRAGRTVDERV